MSSLSFPQKQCCQSLSQMHTHTEVAADYAGKSNRKLMPLKEWFQRRHEFFFRFNSSRYNIYNILPGQALHNISMKGARSTPCLEILKHFKIGLGHLYVRCALSWQFCQRNGNKNCRRLVQSIHLNLKCWLFLKNKPFWIS